MSEYQKQAEQFLTDTNTAFSIRFLYTGTYFPEDTKPRDIFEFTLTNKRGSYTSKFGDSINNTQRRASARHAMSPPNAYDVLVCLEKSAPGSFEEFCSNFGYALNGCSSYPRVMGIYQTYAEQYAALARMFTPEQMARLQEIA